MYLFPFVYKNKITTFAPANYKPHFSSSYRVTRKIGFRVVPVGARYEELILFTY